MRIEWRGAIDLTTRNRKLVPRIKTWTELNNSSNSNNNNNNNNNNSIAFCHRRFLPGDFPLEPTAIPTAQTSLSDCSTFRIMCDVPSTAVFFVVNLLNVFLVWLSELSLNLLLLIRWLLYNHTFHVPHSTYLHI